MSVREIKIDKSTLPNNEQIIQFLINDRLYIGCFIEEEQMFWVNDSIWFFAFDVISWRDTTELKCSCVNIKPTSYQNEVVLNIPKYLQIKYNDDLGSLRKDVSIDKCLTEEIKTLWFLGIKTTGCCCGHNYKDVWFPHISVKDKYIEKMKLLGYHNLTNKCKPESENFFFPKSLMI